MTTIGVVDFGRLNLSDVQLDALMEVRPSPLLVGGGLPEKDAELLRQQLKGVFLSNEEIREVVRKLIGILTAHHQSVFSDGAAFTKGLYLSDPWPDDSFPAVCVTGLGGVGKTEIKKAFLRLLQKAFESMPLRHIEGHAELPFRPVWQVSLAGGTSIGAILLPMLDVHQQESICEEHGESFEEKKLPSPSVIRRQARSQSWRDSTSLIWGDEFQQVSYGSSSNSKAAQLLYQLMLIGPRLVFTGNFSMVRALLRRPQQDTQRLLSVPICVEPTKEGSESALALLDAYKAAAPGVFEFDGREAEPVVHQYTFGINRCKVNLFYHAYIIARKNGRGALRIEDLHAAYVSMDMASQRAEVDELLRGEITGARIREDLMNPLGYSGKENKPKSSNVTDLTKAKERFETKVQEDLLMDSLTPEQAAAVENIDVGGKTFLKVPATVTRISRKKPSKEDLVKGITDFSAGKSG